MKELLSLGIKIFDIIINKENLIVVDSLIYHNDKIIHHNDYIEIPLNNTLIYEDMEINSILFFGDSTIEFHDTITEDAYNWCEFSKDFINKIIKELE